MEEPGRLPSMQLHRAGHDRSDLAVAENDGEKSNLPKASKFLRAL